MPPLTHCAKEVLKTLHKHSSTSVSNSPSRGCTRTVRCAAVYRVAQAFLTHRRQYYCKHGSLPILSAGPRHWHHNWWHAARRKWQRLPTCAVTAWHHLRPIKPQSHCCDCRAIRPTAGVAALSDSMHRDAQAVKANETAVAAMSRA